ncbi:hypothetical protein KI688_005048 [Linnemannia hyalina]|uniref:Uncharacterized protein n=1 Tax=Linnemannia hyalina TaxID=64524 RepID=A0A9P8BRA7_9FUNG|nr:hypothetical protein KI688_005048 [Linnemannia hyalina]
MANCKEHDPLGFRIQDSLPPQQIIKFSYSGILSAFNIPTLNASVLQHSTSLREIRLARADGHCYISASTILKECRTWRNSDETQHFARLEELHRRIGGLKGLRELGLHMPSFNEAGEVDISCLDDPMLFPTMLNLEDARRGRPGFLQHLLGLKKLETLRGLVCVWSDETEVMMEWPEAELVSAPFAWLANRRQGGVHDDVEELRIVADKYDDDAE